MKPNSPPPRVRIQTPFEPEKRSSRLLWVLLVILFALLGAIIVLMWRNYETNTRSVRNSQQYESEKENLANDIQTLKVEKEKLETKIIELERSLDIAQVSSQTAANELVNAQREQTLLQERLSLCKELEKNPALKDSGLRIAQINIFPNTKNQTYNLSLKLQQASQKSEIIQGVVIINLEGKQGKVAKSYSLTDTKLTQNLPLSFDFKYFQELNGLFQLPPGFIPERVRISVKPKNAPVVEEIFSWDRIIRLNTQENFNVGNKQQPKQ